MRRIVLFAATAAVVLAASSGTALAAGQQVCIGGPSTPVSTPDSNGQCKKNYTLTTLATQSEVTDLHSTVTDLQSRVSTLETDNTNLTSRVSTLETDNTNLTSRVSALETTLSKVSYTDSGLNGLPTLKISGANLQIVSGSGATDGTVNGEGNLFIGYDENPSYGPFAQTGSHNLVLGKDQGFTSYGGLIAGQFNTLSGAFADAFGVGNTASGLGSSVSGGLENTASGEYSSVSGGFENTASGQLSSILGGNSVTVDADYGTSP
jgi:hypothetical protein